jgi:hypothetical protein
MYGKKEKVPGLRSCYEHMKQRIVLAYNQLQLQSVNNMLMRKEWTISC